MKGFIRPTRNDLHRLCKHCREHSLLDGQSVWSGDGVAVEEGEKAPEGVEEGPVRQQADALVGVNGLGLLWPQLCAGETQLRALLLCQTLLWVGLVELDGSSIYLDIMGTHRI